MRTDALSSRATAWWLGIICLAGLGLRLYGLGFGLPDVHHPDELTILNRALTFATGDLNPHLFLYPTLYYYALFAWEGLCFVGGYLGGVYSSVAAFQHAFFVDPSHVVLAGRALTAVFGTLTIAAVYRLGARLYDRTTGLVAALLLAVAPFAVRDAHYIKHDVPVTLFIVLAQAAVARLVVDPTAASRRRNWLAAGAFAGLALSTHYYAFPVILPIVAAAIIEGQRTRRWPSAFASLVWAGLSSIAAFLATSPFFLVEFRTVIRDMTAVREIDIDRAVGSTGAFAHFGTYLHMISTDAIGWTAGVAAAIGAIAAIAHSRQRAVVLLCFPLAFLLFLANTVPMNRYLNAMLPSIALAAAFAITWLAARMGPRAPIAVGVLAAAVALPGLLGSVRSDQFFRQADTRTLARAFIERTAAPDSTILEQPHGVQLRQSRDGLVESLRENLGSEAKASFKYRELLALDPYPSPGYRTLYLGDFSPESRAAGNDPDKIYISPGTITGDTGLAALRAQRVEYVVLKDSSDASQQGLRDALARGATLLAEFSPYRPGTPDDVRSRVRPFVHNTDARIDEALERPGPVVQIWRIHLTWPVTPITP